jgi:hypothetical protein
MIIGIIIIIFLYLFLLIVKIWEARQSVTTRIPELSPSSYFNACLDCFKCCNTQDTTSTGSQNAQNTTSESQTRWKTLKK